MDDTGEKAVVEVEFFRHLPQIKIFTYISRVVPFDLGPWKFIIGWRYNPDSMYLSPFYIFNFTTFNRIKEHYYDSDACNLHFLVTSIWVAALSFLSSFNLTSCSAVANCITGLLTTVILCSSNASVCLFGYSKSLLVQIQQRPKQR